MRAVWTAEEACEAAAKSRKAEEKPQENIFTTALMTEPDPGSFAVFVDPGEEAQAARMAELGSDVFLEGHGLPALGSPLWASWRRFFSSDYFQRIWILQEFSLARKVRYHLGEKIRKLDSMLITAVCHAIREHSGANNNEYMRADGMTEDEVKRASNGLQLAWTMFHERVRQTSDAPRARTLIQTLVTGRHFAATDPRDKIFALLGLAGDGAAFQEHVSYAPTHEPVDIFTRFARVFVERGHGLSLLLQSGMGGSLERDVELPSWVPNWADPIPRTNPVLSTSTTNPRASLPSHLRVTNTYTLLARGALLGRITHLNDAFPPL
ncbi:hypothetical protein B0T25DRAFT_618462, partial [Lasiosphaeria hispida]